MIPAAAAITLLFIADDPGLPPALLSVEEQATSRTALVIIPGAPALSKKVLGPGVAQASVGLPRLPVGPPGTSVVPAADGVLVTIDAGRPWTQAYEASMGASTSAPSAPTAPTAPTAPSASSGLPAAEAAGLSEKAVGRAREAPRPWPLPALPVADAGAVRLLVPVVVIEGASPPTPASLHGLGLKVPGQAVSLPGDGASQGPVVLWKSGADVDTAAATLLTAEGDIITNTCTTPGRVMIGGAQFVAGAPTCAHGFAVAPLGGVRYGDSSGSDTQAHGAVVWRLASGS